MRFPPPPSKNDFFNRWKLPYAAPETSQHNTVAFRRATAMWHVYFSHHINEWILILCIRWWAWSRQSTFKHYWLSACLTPSNSNQRNLEVLTFAWILHMLFVEKGLLQSSWYASAVFCLSAILNIFRAGFNIILKTQFNCSVHWFQLGNTALFLHPNRGHANWRGNIWSTKQCFITIFCL